MLKFDKNRLEELEKMYPGIVESMLHFDNASLPICPRCGSENTADVQVGVIGRTINIAAATTKFKLIASGPKPGRYFCNACDRFFNKPAARKNAKKPAKAKTRKKKR